MSETENSNIVLGIDLGTTNTCMSIIQNGRAIIIPIDGKSTMPSVVSFSNFSRHVGTEAKNQKDINCSNTFYEVKRLIGKKFDDISVQNDIPYLSYDISKTETGEIALNSRSKNKKSKHSPEEIASIILSKLKYEAEKYLGKKIKDAVITVPSYFNDSQRQATIDAATIAGLNCLRIINEPTAAALSYGLNFRNEEQTIIVYDLGGGTLDVSLLEIYDGFVEVLAYSGNTHTGGCDFDNKIIKFAIMKFIQENNLSKKMINNISAHSLQRLKCACEKAKILLSEYTKVPIIVENFYESTDLKLFITENEFRKICKGLFIFALQPIIDVLKSAKLTTNDIDDILLVGGSTKMKILRDNIRLFFKGKELNTSVNPDESVAIGAAIQGHIMTNDDSPFSENIVLLDIVSLSMGVEVIGGVMNVLIPRNSKIPIKRKKIFTTDSDYQDVVTIKIYEGEREMTADNYFIGKFDLTNIEKAPRGVAKIEIIFEIDANGIVNISAVDKNNCNNKNKIKIKSNTSRLTKQQIDKLIQESIEMKSNDIKMITLKRTLYEIDDLCSNILFNIDSRDVFLPDSEKNKIRNRLKNILEFTENNSNDINKLQNIKKGLNDDFGTLILKTDYLNNSSNLKAMSEIHSGTSVIDEDEDEKEFCDYFELSEKKDSINIYEKKEELLSMCYLIQDILPQLVNPPRNISKNISDIILWLRVCDDLTSHKIDVKIKMLNEICGELENVEFKKLEPIDELEELCFSIKCFIECNMHSGKETDNIVKEIDETLDMTAKYKIKGTVDDDIVQKKIKYFEQLFDNINKTSIGMNLNFNNYDNYGDSGTLIHNLQ